MHQEKLDAQDAFVTIINVYKIVVLLNIFVETGFETIL